MRKAPQVSAIEALVERMLGDRPNHQVAQRLQAEVQRLRDRARQLDDMNISRTPLDTDAAHALKVAKAARKLGEERAAAFDRIVKIWADGRQNLQRQIEDKINLKPDGFAAEIRTAFRSLDAKGKAALLDRLIEENRGPEMAAILKAPAMLSGISDEQRAVYEQAITSKHAGDLVEEQAYLDGVYEAATASERAVADLVKGLTDPHKLAQIEREDTAARNAAAAFDQSLQ